MSQGHILEERAEKELVGEILRAAQVLENTCVCKSGHELIDCDPTTVHGVGKHFHAPLKVQDLHLAQLNQLAVVLSRVLSALIGIR